jgi:hypothetical protein
VHQASPDILGHACDEGGLYRPPILQPRRATMYNQEAGGVSRARIRNDMSASVRDSPCRCRRLIFGTIDVSLRLLVDLGEVCIRLSVFDWL